MTPTSNTRLVVIGGDIDVREVTVESKVLFGRGRDVDVQLGHPLVSRNHCRVENRDGALWVVDLGSLNGTFVNRDRVENEALLPPNGLLTIGTVTFRVNYAGDEAAVDQSHNVQTPADNDTRPVGMHGLDDTVPQRSERLAGQRSSREEQEDPHATIRDRRELPPIPGNGEPT